MDRAHLDYQIRLDNVSQDLESLGRAIGYGASAAAVASRDSTTPNGGNGSRTLTVWKCPLGRENDGTSKAKLAVSKADFTAVLARSPALTQR